MCRQRRFRAFILTSLTMVLVATEPTVGFNGWTNTPGVVEGTVTTRPVDTTLPRPPLGYVVYLPKGYDPGDSTKRWPLLVMMLGVGEIGDGTDTAANGHQLYAKMTTHGPLYQVVRKKWDFPCIVIAPQPTNLWNTASIMLPMCEYMKTNYRVDANRIYLTGLCDGAIGLLNFAANHIGYLAGIMPIGTAALPNAGWAANIRNLPMWEAHCYNDQTIARTSSIAWFDQATKADIPGAYDLMSTYPGYNASPLHVAADRDPSTLKPLNPFGPITTVASATLTSGSSWIAFNSTTFGSSMFNTWGGTEASPYAVVTPGGGVVALGKPTGLYLTRPYTGVTETRNLTIQIPVGYNCTAYFDPLTKKWAWQRGQSWDTTKPGKRIFTMFWYQNHVNGWVETYANGGCWDWLFSQSKAAAGVPAITSQPKNATVAAGQTATFSATATGSGPLYYLWKRNGAAIAGATAASYTTAPLSLADSGTQFTLSVSNGSGSTTSTAAIVTVLAIQPSEPNLAINGWSNIPGKVEGTLRVRPVNTTSPRPPYGYLDYLPLGYNPANTMTKWPLIVHLPHITEAGDGTDSAANGNQLYNQLVKYGPLHLVVSQQWDFPAVIIAPQVVTNWTKPLNVKNVVEYAKANYRIDSNRIYMTGHLEGANGTLRYAVAYPGDLAGVLTIASTAVASTAQATLIRSLPLWATHSFADQTCPRSVSIGWIDALSSAQYGGTSDAMATYPGYGNRSHFAIDSNPLTRTPLNPDGEVITIAGARLATGSKTITFPSGVQFGSGIFAMWNGSDTQPFARVRVAGEAPFYVVAQGYASSLNLTAAYAGSATTASITIQTPVGYNATAYRNANGTWDWNRDLPWDQTRSDLRVLSLFWYQSATMGANQTWDNVSPWNWLLGQVKAPAGSG